MKVSIFEMPRRDFDTRTQTSRFSADELTVPTRPRAPLGFKAIMTIPQPTAFLALIHGHDGECPCSQRQFADAG